MSKSIRDQVEETFCPPGNGVYTISTAKDRKEALHQRLYGETEPEKVEQAWKNSLDSWESSKAPFLFGICSDTGGGILRGANWGPLFIREALAKHHPELKYFDLGDVRVIPHLLHDKYLNESTIKNCRKALYQNEQSEHPVSPLSLVESFVKKHGSKTPWLALGGDHSVSYSLVRPYLENKKSQGKKVAIIHFDAHTDLLKERLGIDICFGSWAAHVLDLLATPAHLIQFGIRSSAKTEQYWEKEFGVQQYWTEEIQKRGPAEVAGEVLTWLKKEKIDELYVSFDIDAIDAKYASATGTPEVDGLAPHECQVILETLAQEFPITGADLVEVAPFLKTESDSQGLGQESTLLVASGIAQFLLKSLKS